MDTHGAQHVRRCVGGRCFSLLSALRLLCREPARLLPFENLGLCFSVTHANKKAAMLAVTAPNPERLVELEAACAAHAGEARRWAIKLRRQSPALKLATLKVCLGYDLPSLTRLLLADGVLLASRFENGDTALHGAVACNALRVLRLLLDSGADTNAKEELGRTALHDTEHFGHLKAIRMLLDAHAQINATGNKGWTAIMLAANDGKASACELLAACGADLLATDADGYTVIHLAAEQGHANVVKVLLPHLRRLGNVDLRTVQSQRPGDNGRMYGCTALHLACMDGHHLVAKRVLAAGASRTSTVSHGYTPLHCAARFGHLACLTLVMGHPGAYLLSNAKLDVQDTDGETPLYVAAYGGHDACCSALIAAGADTAKAAKDGSTPLSIAQSRHADKPQLIALLEAHSGANVGTPLVLLCEGCGKPSTEAPRGRLRACAACQGATFCGPECAQRGWLSGHQAECSRIIAAKKLG